MSARWPQLSSQASLLPSSTNPLVPLSSVDVTPGLPRMPRLGYSRPDFSSPQDPRPTTPRFSSPDFSSPDFGSPDFGGPDHAPD